jgi:DNA-binding MarR family transcriptional regulator
MTTSPLPEHTSRPIQLVAKELAASSGFLLARLGFVFKAKAQAAADQEGFELYDYSLLAILAEGVRATQSTMADAVGLDPSRLVALLDSLEERGLVARQRDPLDRRRHVVSITAAGTRELSKIRAAVKKVEDEFFAPLDVEARKAFHELLARLAAKHDPGCGFGSAELLPVEDAPTG